MKKFLIAAVAVLLISAGTNASNKVSASKSSLSFYEDYVMRSSMEKLKKIFTPHIFYSYYDSGSGQTWIFVGNDNLSTGMVITTAYYLLGGSPVYATWVENPSGGYGTYTNEWYWIDATNVHVTCLVHYNTGSGYFTVDDDMTI